MATINKATTKRNVARLADTRIHKNRSGEEVQSVLDAVHKHLQRARVQEFETRKSTNKRYQMLEYGVKRLARIEKKLEEEFKNRAHRYEKSYPNEMVYFDTKTLPRLAGETKNTPKEYIFVAIDDFSRELFFGVFPERCAESAKKFLAQVIEECGYTIECVYSDNGAEYKRDDDHPFVKLCAENEIKQHFTRFRRPQTNGKAERVIRTLMDIWHTRPLA